MFKFLLIFMSSFLGHGFSFNMKFRANAISKIRGQNILKMKTELVGAILEVKDPIDSLRFYQSHLKLPVDEFDQKVYLTDNVALQFHKNQEIIKMGEDVFGVSVQFGNSCHVMSMIGVLPRAKVLQPFGHYLYGASMVPDEDYMLQHPAQYGVFADEDNFPVEIHQKQHEARTSCKLMIRVLDLNESIEFYTRYLKLELLRKRSNVNNYPPDASMCAHLGNPPESDSDSLQLLYLYGTDEKIKRGNVFQKLLFRCDDMNEMKTGLQDCGQGLQWKYNPSDNYIELVDPNGVKIVVSPS